LAKNTANGFSLPELNLERGSLSCMEVLTFAANDDDVSGGQPAEQQLMTRTGENEK